MNADLHIGRHRVDTLMEAAQSPFLAYLAIAASVIQAEVNNRSGDIYDTRKLAFVLAQGLTSALERADEDLATLYSAKLLSVLSDIADDGDEDAALAVTEAGSNLPPLIFRMAGAYSRLRKMEAR